MADNRRAGERTIFRGDVEGNDTLAEISRALEMERRAPIAVGAGFVPPAGGQASNIPAMADLEDELLREFALYEGPREAVSREPLRKSEPRFESAVLPVKGPTPPVASPVSLDDDDDTMPPMDDVGMFRAAPIVRAPLPPAPVVAAARVEPEPPAVIATTHESELDVSAADVEDAADAGSDEPVAFAGPIPELDDWDDLELSDSSADAGEVTPEIANDPASDVAADLSAGQEGAVFSGPVPELDFDEEPAFAGPVPDIEFDEAAAFDADAVFAGPVPDLDFTDGQPEADVEEIQAGDDALDGELEQSLGALDLTPDVGAEPASPFAAWKNDRLAAVETTTPAWLSATALAPARLEVMNEEAVLAPGEDERAGAPARVLNGDYAVPDEPSFQVVPDSDLLDDLEFELDADDLIRSDASEAVGNVEAADVDMSFDLPSDASPSSPKAEQAAFSPYVSVAPATLAFAAKSAAVAAPVAEPSFDLPDWLQPEGKADSSGTAGQGSASEPDFDFKEFEFDFDEDAIEAEVSRAVMSELQSGNALAPSDELPFDPSAITEIEDAMPASVAGMDVPQVPEQDGEAPPKPVSDFDFDIEAEMAELFAMGNKTKEQVPATPAAPQQEGEVDGLANEIIRSIHEAPTIPAGRAFDIAEIDAASPSFVSRYARLAAAAAIVAFAGLAAVMLWRSGDVPGVATDGSPRVILADKTPIKEVPEQPGGKQVPNQDKAVYDRVAGKSPEVVKQDSLIANSEEPVNVAEKTLGDEAAAMPENQIPGVADAAAAGDADARLPATPGQAGADSQAPNESVAPRKVKTMIVLPNGTLVARETTVPADAAAPAKPAGADAAMTAPAATAKVEAAQPGATLAPPAGAPAAQPTEQAATEKTPPAKPVAMPIPTARPAEQPVNVVGTVTQRGNVVGQQAAPAEKPAPQPAAAAVASSAPAGAPAGAYVIQIASLPSQEEAQKSYSNLSAKFSSVIGGKGVDIKPAEIPGKGTFYRLRIVAGSKDDAIALCTRYKAAGGSCLVSR